MSTLIEQYDSLFDSKGRAVKSDVIRFLACVLSERMKLHVDGCLCVSCSGVSALLFRIEREYGRLSSSIPPTAAGSQE